MRWLLPCSSLGGIEIRKTSFTTLPRNGGVNEANPKANVNATSKPLVERRDDASGREFRSHVIVQCEVFIIRVMKGGNDEATAYAPEIDPWAGCVADT